MLKARRALLVLGAAALVAIALAWAVPVSAQGGGARRKPSGGIPLDAQGGVPVTNAFHPEGISATVRTDPPLERSALGPISGPESLERMIQGTTFRTASGVTDQRQAVADTAGVDERQPTGCPAGVFSNPADPDNEISAQGGIIVSSNGLSADGTGVKGDFDLWIYPFPSRPPNSRTAPFRSKMKYGLQITQTGSRNERRPVVGSGGGAGNMLAYVGEVTPPPSPDLKQDHVFVQNPANPTDVRDVTTNFVRGTGAGEDPDGWDIHSITFNAAGAVVFASDYGMPAGNYKLWKSTIPGPGGSATTALFAPVAGMDTDAWIYDNPAYNPAGTTLAFDSNRNLGGTARRIYAKTGAVLKQITDGSKQVAPVGDQILQDTRPQFIGGNPIVFLSNRLTGSGDTILDVNVWMLTNMNDPALIAEGSANPDFRVIPLDEISSSGDAPAAFSAFSVTFNGLPRRYLAQEFRPGPNDGNCYVTTCSSSSQVLPAATTDMPIINGGIKDLSKSSNLVVQADVRAFPVPAYQIQDAAVDQVRAWVWNPERDPGIPPIVWETVTRTDPWVTAGPGGDTGWADAWFYQESDGVDMGFAFRLYNNPYEDAMTTFYFERTFDLKYDAAPGATPGYWRWSNSANPLNLATLNPKTDKLLGMQVIGGMYDASLDREDDLGVPIGTCPYEFVYDNLSGFTTREWKPNPQANCLLVDDYQDGQLFISQIQRYRFGTGVAEESSYRAVGYPVAEYWGLQPNGTLWRDGTNQRTDMFWTPNELLTGGGSAPFDADVFFNPMPPDRWRVACRGPVPDDIMNGYLPELNPYQVYDTKLGSTPAAQYRGPFTVTLDKPIAQGGKPSTPTPVKVYPEIRGVIWGSPYAGDLFVDKGTITDAQTHATIQQFVDKGGGILLSGQDIAWALTVDGAAQSPFLTDVFGATYVRDDVGNQYGKVNGLTYDDPDLIAPGHRGPCPADPDANPVAFPPGLWTPWWTQAEPGTDVDPNQLRFPYLPPDTSPTGHNWYYDGAGGIGYFPPFDIWYYDGFQQAWPDVIASAGANTKIAYNYASSQGVAAVFTQHPSTNTDLYWGGRTAFLGFGLEGVSREYNAFTIGSTNYAECLLKRNKIIQNFLDWARTCTMEGYVTAGYGIPGIPGGTPLPNVLVVAEPLTATANRQIYAMLTDSAGFYHFRGLPVDWYQLKAFAPGMNSDHSAGLILYPEGTNESGGNEGFSMLQAPVGSIAGTVRDAVVTDSGGVGIPLAGIRVVAEGKQADGTDLINPATGKAIQGEALTAQDGTYMVKNLPSGISYAVIANPPPKAAGVQANHATDDTTYNVGGTGGLKAVTPAAVTPSVDFLLGSVPGNVKGLVYQSVGTTKIPIPGALVAVAGLTPALSVVSDSQGNYNFAVAGGAQLQVPAGAHVLEATAPGFIKGSVNVTVVSNQTITADIALIAAQPGTVSGKVTSSDGLSPIADVTVEAFFASETTPRVSAASGAAGTYTLANVPAADYTVKARDPLYNRNFTPAAGRQVSVGSGQAVTGADFAVSPLKVFTNGVRIISTPYSYPDADPADILGLTPDTLKLAWWSPQANQYIVYPAGGADRLVRGKGYFTKLDTHSEISRKGVPADPAVLQQPFDISLDSASGGWNLVGAPYDFEVDWTKSTVLYQNGTMSLDDAVQQHLIVLGLFGYDTTKKAYYLNTAMAPYVGYWAKAYVPGLTVRVSNQAISEAVAARGSQIATAGAEWSVQLIAEAGGYADTTNYLGMVRAGSGREATLDIEEPPMARSFAGEDVTLYFPHVDADGHGRNLAADYRAASTGTATWDLVVDSAVTGAEVTLRWPDLRSLPRTLSATLEDMATSKTVAMRSLAEYRFTPATGEGPRRFRVTVRSNAAGGNPTPQVLGVDSMARGVSVSYRLVMEADVSVTILNQAGRVVRSLVSGEARGSGVHSEMWDGRDDAGRALPSGEYRIEIRAVTADGSVGRASARAVR